MQRPPLRARWATRALATCAAIAVLASGIGFTTGTAAHAETALNSPFRGTSEAPDTEGIQADSAVSDTFQESPESPETPESTETPRPDLPEGTGETTEVAPAEDVTDPAGETPDPQTPGGEDGTAPGEHSEPAEEPAPVEPDDAAPAPLPSIGPLTNAAGSIGEAEPNGSTARAQSIPLGTTVNARFGPKGDCDNGFYDCDTYRINAPSAGRLVLDLRFASTLGTTASVNVQVLNAAGTRTHNLDVSASDFTGAKLRQTFLSVAAGTSYIMIKSRVSSFGATPVWKDQPYTLNATVQAGAVEIEPNSKTSQATPLTLGTRITGASLSPDCNNLFYDCDYYRLSIPERASLTVDFRASCALATSRPYRVSVLDNAGKSIRSVELGGPDCGGKPFAVTLPAGNAYIEVYTRADRKGHQVNGLPYTLVAGMKLTAATPTISGKLASGSTLTAKPGKWGPGKVAFGYQWKRDGKAISSAKKSTYKLGAADVGRRITVTVTGSKSGFSPVSRTSAQKSVPTTFIDVPRSQKFYSEIQWMYDTKRTTGVKTAKGLAYQPKSGVTREAMAAFIFRQEAKKGYKAPKKSPFRDVSPGDKFYKEIAWMYEQGISTGTKTRSGRVYQPRQHVTREAMAAFLFRLRAPDSTKAPSKAPFADVPAKHKFGREIAWMKSSKLSTGTKRGGTVVYEPRSTVTREAMAAFLFRMDRSVPAKSASHSIPKLSAPGQVLSGGRASITGNGRSSLPLAAPQGAGGQTLSR